MPVLSSFISYRPKRKTKAPIQVSSPFPVNTYNSPPSPHPYAPPRIIDINDGRVPAHSSNVPEPSSYHGLTATPRVELNVEINPDPLTDWFPTTFLNSDPSSPMIAGETAGASGGGTYHGVGYDVTKAERSNGIVVTQEAKAESITSENEGDDDEELYILSSAEEVVANLEAMDASNFVGQLDKRLEPPQPSSKKPAPTPIKIPNSAIHGSKVQVIRSSELSRPTSQVSSPESSAISGTTLARALLANTFVLSGETRTSRYRSGSSTLTRTDSATLPRGEFSFIHSPYWRETTSGDSSLSPNSAPLQPVPPVPVNAELVYVPPQTTRQSPDARERRRTSTPGSAQSDQPEAGRSGKEQEEDTQASRRISRITEATSSQPSTPQLANPIPEVVQDHPKSPLAAPKPPPLLLAPSDRLKSRRYSIRPETGMSSEGIVSPSALDAPSSAKDLDNVLDYYSFADTPEPVVERNFRPPFSPITEESTSQLSPPTPYNRPDSRGSKPSLPPGRFFLGTTSSAPISGVRVDWNVRNSESRSALRNSMSSSSKPLLPIGDRSGNQNSSNSSINSRVNSSTSSSSTSHEASNNNLLPPPASSVFNRLRPGNAPSPIKVVRDPHDLTAYNITVTPRTNGSTGSTPTTGDSDIIQQTFPETPSAFSPGFSPNGMASPGMRGSGVMGGDYTSMAVPKSPMSAFLPAASSIQPSLAQQVLLTRAATSVHGARHSRQASLTRLLRQQGHPYARPSSIVMSVTPEAEGRVDEDNVASSSKIGDGALDKAADDGAASTTPMEVKARVEVKPLAVNGVHETQAKIVVDKCLPDEPEPSPQLTGPPPLTPSQRSSPLEPLAPVLGTVSLPAMTPTPPTQTPLPNAPVQLAELPTTPSSMSHGSEEAVLAYDVIASDHDSVETGRAPSRAASKRSNVSADSLNMSAKVLPRVHPATPRLPPAPTITPPAPPSQLPTEPSVSHNKEGPSTSSSSLIGTSVTPSAGRRQDAPPSPRTEPVQTLASVIKPVTSNPLTITESPSARRPGLINPPPPQLQLPPPQPSASSLYSLSYDAGLSPPSYNAVINSDRAAAEAITPSTSASYDLNYRFGTPYQPHSPPPNGGEFVVGSSADRAPLKGPTQSSTNPRRTRARPPLPAGPRRPSQQHSSMASVMRERGGSVSSVTSQMPSSRRLHAAPLPSPRFQTPAPKWRGYTMDAAKWTFTSTQLQAIVSRAIKQSSEASSIRLLQLETLDNEIPPEVERLETLRTDTKVKYKTLARRRMGLLDSLANCVDGLDQDGPAHAIQLVENLKDVTGAMDRLTEELHSTDEQLAQLTLLCQGHLTSALAMALRKLNASFLKQFAEARELRQQVETLEAERDEAWREAQNIAHEFEDLKTGKIESPDAENRFDRVMAVRKSSIRATKAGLRSTSRSNQRASSSSSRALVINTPSSTRTTYVDDFPSVPPIPRRRPVDIMTDIPLRSSTVTGASTDGPTPTSETRAMVRAQEELYDMLGIPLNDHRSRRSRSVIGVPGESELSQQVTTPLGYTHYEVPPNTGRRASLPESAALPPYPYNTLTADVSIILNSDRAGWI